MRRTLAFRRAPLALGLAVVAAFWIWNLQTTSANDQNAVAPINFDYDVACDATSFAVQGPVGPAGPEYGASFVVQGFIYPEGTFAVYGSDSGILPSGEPEFPELVIGTWTCRGWFIGEGFATPTGPFVATTQIYDLDPAVPGKTTFVSEGTELIDVGVPFMRAITGGTGSFRRARGEIEQTAIGANATGLFNFTFRH